MSAEHAPIADSGYIVRPARTLSSQCCVRERNKMDGDSMSLLLARPRLVE